MNDGIQTVAKGAGNFFVDQWVPILLDPYTWIAMLVSWAFVESIKQFNFVYKQQPETRKDIARVLSITAGYSCAYVAYDVFLHLDKAYILATAVGILNPFIYLWVTGIMNYFEPTRKILDFVKPHRRNKFIPLPKDHEDDITTYTMTKEEREK